MDDVFRYVYLRVGGVDLAEDLTAAARRAARAEFPRSAGPPPTSAPGWCSRRTLIEEQYGVGRYRLEVDELAELDPASLDSLRRLSSDQQECVSLRFLQGFSVAATARILEVKPAAVAVLQWQALRSLVPDVGLELFETTPDERPRPSAHSQESAA